MKEVTFTPGAVAAGTNIALPAGYRFARLVEAQLRTIGDFANAASSAPVDLAVVDAAPAAGEVQLVDEQTVVLGDATTQYTELALRGEGIGERVRP